MSRGRMQLQAIGYVENGIIRRPPRGWSDVRSKITVLEAFSDALLGIEEYRHLLVVFWFDQKGADDRGTTRVHPMRRKDLPLRGVFATRSPARPNPLGVTEVRLLDRDANVLYVEGLDALHDTPVIDIKGTVPPGQPGPAWHGR